MLRDIGFWNKNGEYIEDYQEVGEEEMALSINDINKLEQENAELKAENTELKERNEKIIVGYVKLSERYKQTLQEIKAIVCGNYEIIDPQGRKDILKLITKAESEDNQ